MQVNIDTGKGEMHLGSGLLLTGGLTMSQLSQMGVAPTRVFDMKTGWVFWTIGPYEFFNHPVYLSLGFEQGVLQRVTFSFAVEIGASELRAQHDQLLRTMLGSPQEESVWETTYEYPWGSVASSSDPKGGQATIIVSWIKLAADAAMPRG